MTEPAAIRDEFLAECSHSLGFLKDEYGFSGPEVEDHYPSDMVVSYTKREIAIECNLDVRDEDAYIRIARLENGRIPDVWRVNKKGEVVSEYLHTLLRHQGVRDMKYDEPKDEENLSRRQRSFRKLIAGDVRLLRKYGQSILDGSASIFESYDAPGDQF